MAYYKTNTMKEESKALTVEDAAALLLRRKRCRESLVGFAQNIQIPTVPLSGKAEDDRPDDDVDGASLDESLLRPVGSGVAAHHVLMMEHLQRTMETSNGRLMLFLPPGSAKALALDTPIATPVGWSTMGELRVGDEVFDDAGQVCRVIRKSDVFKDRPCYCVKTDCGDQIIADQEHEWLVRLSGNARKELKANGKGTPPRPDRDDPTSRFKLKQTWDLAKHRAKRPMVKRAEALQLPEIDLPINPYLLGVWLGDGNSAGMRITQSIEDQLFVRGEIERLGYKTTDQSVATNFGVLGVRGLFVQFGLVNDPAHNTFGEKGIPGVYLRASYEQRLALLQGLIDTDGTVCRKSGSATFCNTNLGLALQFRELVRTLGVKAGWSVTKAVCNGKNCGLAYKVSFYHAKAARLPRKARLCRDQYRTPNTYIDVAALTQRQDTICIEVDSPSHLFLAGRSMTPTHNSTYGSVVAPTWRMGKVPGTQIILGSYNTALAKKHGSRGRFIVQQPMYRGAFGTGISAQTQAKELWTLDNGSEYMSGGLQSGLTGNRADGLIIDDPVRGRADAKSELVQTKTIDAYEDDAVTRLKPGGWRVLITTRWDLNDLAGMILPKDYAGQSGMIDCRDGEKWMVLNIPAKCKHLDDPLGRRIGEYLWPEWFDAKHWRQYEPRPGDPNSPNQRRWDSLFQQEPRPETGNQFEAEWINWYEPGHHPKHLMLYSFSDYAVTDPKDSDDPDFTEHGIGGLDEAGNLWIVDWYYAQATTDYTIPALINLCKKWNVRNGFGEMGIIRRSIESQFVMSQREHDYWLSIEYLPHIGDKVAKFSDARALGSAGKLYLPDTPWAHRLVKQLVVFPSPAMKDDGVDVISLAARATKDMIWSVAKVTKPKSKGVVFGSWEWLTMGTEDKPKVVNQWK